MTQHDEQPGPYATACERYWAAGWRGILPLPARSKSHPPVGWTGRQGGWPSMADVLTWAGGREGAGNIGLRLPRAVIGLDVDNYAGKIGAATLHAAERRWGALPATWRSTSRDDGISGIRLYLVPEGLAFPGELGPGTEVIQHNHRYVVSWPSIHPEGRVYRWITPDGATAATAVPTLDDLPELPAAWIEGLTGGQLETDVPKADLDDVEAVTWLVKYGAGEPCGLMHGEVDRYIANRFSDYTSRHDAAKDATARLAHLAADGHAGAYTAIEQIRTAFVAATENDPARPRDPGEWKRLLTGAIRIAAVDTQGAAPADDPCNVTVIDLSILDDATVDPQQAVKDAQQRALEAEVNVQRIRREARTLLDQEDAARSFREPPFRPTLVEELEIPDEPISYAVDKVMPTGANVLLTAQFKTGKTTLVNHLTRCLADLDRFLGVFDVAEPNGRIALFNYEVDERQYRRWLRDLDIAAAPLVTVLNLRGYRLPLVNKHVEDWIVRWLEERYVAVWIVDPFARAFVGSGVSENDNTEVGRFLDTLDVIKTRAGVSELVLPTHTGRQEMDEGQERARGATRLDDWADVRWLLTKDENDKRFFRATGRDVEVEALELTYDEAARRLESTGVDRATSRRNRAVDIVALAVETNPGIALARLREAVREMGLKGRNEDLDEWFRKAVQAGRIRVEAYGNGSARKHFPVLLNLAEGGS